VARLLPVLSVAAVMAGALAAPVLAADLLLPPPPVLEGDEVVELGNGWYLRGDVGYIDYDTPQDRGTSAFGIPRLDDERLEQIFSLGGGVGYQLSSWLRTDLTIDHRFGAEFTGTRPFPTYAFGSVIDKTDLESTSFLLNGYIDLGYWAGVTPYIGAGAGFSINRLTNFTRLVTVNTPPSFDAAVLGPHTTYNFAWALMAGAAVDVGSGFKLDLGYRFVRLGDARSRFDADPSIRTDSIQAHEIRVGARYMID
jgi:opacity protein-like surface antigen